MRNRNTCIYTYVEGRNIQYALNHTRFIREQENLGFITEQPNRVSMLFQKNFLLFLTDRKGNIVPRIFTK